MSVNKPEQEVIDPTSEGRFEKGTEVGNMAKGILGDYVDVTTRKEDGSLDLLAMLQKTQEYMLSSYYLPSMGGSFSIKRVLPSLYPDDPSLDYHNLEGGVQNGNDAMTIFPKIQYMSPEEQKETRKALLEYCGLDTYAMVKVWESLKKV